MDTTGNAFRIDPSQSGPWAKLFLFSQRNYGNLVLRPFVYGFTEEAANFLLGKGDSLSEAFNRKDVQNTESVASMIRPDSIGTEIDMSGFNNMWTFTLVIHIPNNCKSGILAAEGAQLMVFKGHCGEEPLDPNSVWMSTPIINRNCPLFVHSREILRANPTTINAFGSMGTVDVCGVTDVIDGCINMCSKDKELLLMTPSNVLENFSVKGISNASAAGLCSIANDRKTVQTELKDPGLHLRQILQGIDASIDEAASREYAPHGIDSFSGALSPAADVAQFKATVVNQLSAMNGPSDIEQGIAIKSVVTIGDVERAYPNLIVQPQQISSTPQMEILPQDYQSKRTFYSSMAASAISAIAAGCGLSSISFQYQSYDPKRKDELIKSSFAVISDNAFLTYPPANPEMYNSALVAAVKLFRYKFENDVVPFIRLPAGDFFIQSTYSNNAETTVNLQFLDDTRSTNGTGWLETPNRLSSLSSTSIGDKENFDSNGHALNAFVAQIQGHTQVSAITGLPAFERPGIDFGNSAPVDLPLGGMFGQI